MRNDNLWFTNTRMQVRLSNRDNDKGLSIIENFMPCGFSPPLHVHHAEDETFYVLEGIFQFEMDGRAITAGPGALIHIPAGATHSFLVVSAEGGRCLTVTQGGFEDMVREASRPAANDGLPDTVQPTEIQQRMLADACRSNGIELRGAPLAA